MRGRWGWLWSIGVAACVLDTGGVGSSAANTLGPGPGDTGTTELDTSVDSTQGPGTLPADESTTQSDPLTTGPPGDADLVISHGPEYDFGDIPVATLAAVMLTVTNEGDAEATGMVGIPLSAPFHYTGRPYPGAAGTCADTLAAHQSCTLDVSFVPEVFGPHADTLTLDYNQGSPVSRALVGGGSGQSENLLINPGGEDQNSPPPGWNYIGPGNWGAGDPSTTVNPYEGGGYLFVTEGPNLEDYTMAQDVDVSQWAPTIDLSQMRFEFSGRARTHQAWSGYVYRLRLSYRAGDGSEISSWNSGEHDESLWQLHSTGAPAPPGTRSIRVELECNKDFNLDCSAYFDALQLRAVYP